MRVLMLWKGRSQLPSPLNERARDVHSFAPLAVFILQSPDNQSPHGRPGLSSALAQSVVQGLGNVYSGTNRHS
jgi:hypothetical protein